MSALHPKADIDRGRLECPLIAISGHSDDVNTSSENSSIKYNCIAFEDYLGNVG